MDDGSMISGATIFVSLVALFVFAVGGAIVFLTLRGWHKKSKEIKNESIH